MHCVACDGLLTDYETSLKNASTDEYTDMCLRCLRDIDCDLVVYSLHDENGEEDFGGPNQKD